MGEEELIAGDIDEVDGKNDDKGEKGEEAKKKKITDEENTK